MGRKPGLRFQTTKKKEGFMESDLSKSAAQAATGEPGAAIAPPPRAVWVAGIVLAVVGAAAFAVQMANQSMAGGSHYPWGFYIALFYAAASAGAGLLMVAGIARWAGAIGARDMGVLYAVACALFVVASVLIVVDLGNPAAILLTYASANPASPVFFDAIVLPLCIAFAVAAALFAGKGEAAGRTFALAGVVAGLALLAVEAWLLTTCSGRDAWGVLLGAGPALIQAAALGIAIVVLCGPARRGWRALLAGAALVMTASLVFDVVLNQGDGTVLGAQFAAIAASPLFWAAAVMGLAAVVLLALPAASALVARVAAACAVAAVPLFKLAIFQATQSVVPLAELEAAGAAPFNAMELVVFAGAVGVGTLVYAAALRILAARSTAAANPAAAANAKEVQAS